MSSTIATKDATQEAIFFLWYGNEKTTYNGVGFSVNEPLSDIPLVNLEHGRGREGEAGTAAECHGRGDRR